MGVRSNLNSLNVTDHMGWGPGTEENRKPKPFRNKHTEGYDDDGTVITMTLKKFFSAVSDYSQFLNNGARSHISLTTDSGDEVFQFGLLEKFHGDVDQDMSDLECRIAARNKKTNITVFTQCITDSDKPIIMKSMHGRVYGVLYPSVTLDLAK